MQAPPEQQFRMSSGEAISSVEELADHLAQASEEEYTEHIGEGRNDYAGWIKHALQEEDLAHEVEVATTKEEAVAALRNAATAEVVEEVQEQPVEEPVEEVHEEHVEEVHEEPAEEQQHNEPEEHVEEVHEPAEVQEASSTSEHHHVHIEFVYGIIFGVLLCMLAYGIYSLL